VRVPRQGRVAVGQGAEGLVAVLRAFPEAKEAETLVAQGDDAPEAAGYRLAGGHGFVVLGKLVVVLGKLVEVSGSKALAGVV